MGQGVLATVSQWECLVFLLTYKSVPYITYAIDEMADYISTTTHLPLSYEYCLLRTSIGTLKRAPIKPLQKSELFFNHPWIITYVLRRYNFNKIYNVPLTLSNLPHSEYKGWSFPCTKCKWPLYSTTDFTVNCLHKYRHSLQVFSGWVQARKYTMIWRFLIPEANLLAPYLNVSC